MAFRIARRPDMASVPTERTQGIVEATAEEAVSSERSRLADESRSRYDRQLFLPKPRGNLSAALENTASLATVAPETPRPAEMLESVVVTGDDRLTAQDLSLHELLVAHAYQVALDAAGANRGTLPELGETEIPMRQVLTYLGPSTRRQHVRKSLKTLRRTEVSYGLPGGRHFVDVPLLVGWGERDGNADVVRYSLPSPIWTLMASQRRYAYLELGAIAGMSSRFGVRLYRHLAARFAFAEWDPNGVPEIVEATPEEVAGWLGYVESPLHVGHLATALKRAVEDLRHVRRLDVSLGQPRRAKKRGAPIERFTLEVSVREPTIHQVRATRIDADLMPHIGGVDDPRYRVNQSVWVKAQELARKRRVATFATWLSEAWLVALHEALSDVTFTDDAARRLRGKRLLRAIQVDGPDKAAWAWAVEEIAGPDLLKLWDAVGGKESTRILREARRARFHRWRDHREGEGRGRREKRVKVAPVVAPEAVDEKAARLARARARFDGNGNTIEFLSDRAFEAINEFKLWPNRHWNGSKVFRVLARYKFEGSYRTDAVGYLPLSWDDVVGMVERRSTPWDEFFVTHDETLPAVLEDSQAKPAAIETHRYVGQPDGSVVVEVTRVEPAPALPRAVQEAEVAVAVAVDDNDQDAVDPYDWERDHLIDDIEPPALDFDPVAGDILEVSDDIPF